jgi:hypothetical protein
MGPAGRRGAAGENAIHAFSLRRGERGEVDESQPCTRTMLGLSVMMQPPRMRVVLRQATSNTVARLVPKYLAFLATRGAAYSEIVTWGSKSGSDRATGGRGGLGNGRGDVLVAVAFDDGLTPAWQQRIGEHEFRPMPVGGARGKFGILHRVP